MDLPALEAPLRLSLIPLPGARRPGSYQRVVPPLAVDVFIVAVLVAEMLASTRMDERFSPAECRRAAKHAILQDVNGPRPHLRDERHRARRMAASRWRKASSRRADGGAERRRTIS